MLGRSRLLPNPSYLKLALGVLDKDGKPHQIVLEILLP